jgi:hypothetical protein
LSPVNCKFKLGSPVSGLGRAPSFTRQFLPLALTMGAS